MEDCWKDECILKTLDKQLNINLKCKMGDPIHIAWESVVTSSIASVIQNHVKMTSSIQCVNSLYIWLSPSNY